MNEEPNWDEIIVYVDIPFEANGVFWMPSNKIYICSLIKKYDALHEYILRHEKKHYLNYNSDRNTILKLLKDVQNEWCGYLQKRGI